MTNANSSSDNGVQEGPGQSNGSPNGSLVPGQSQKPDAPPAENAADINFGRFSRAVARKCFSVIPVPDPSLETLRMCSAQGDVVHVMHTSNVLGAFFLSWLLPAKNLPPLKTAIGLKWSFWKPLRKLIHKGSCEKRIDAALDGQHSALVFLNTPSGLVPHPTPQADPFFALVARARTSKRPLFLVPETFVWSARPPSLRPGLKEFLLGSAESPHRLVSAWGFANNYRSTYFRTGQVLNLTEFVAGNASDTDEMLVHKVRGLLSQDLVREMRAIVGPPAKPRERIIEETLRDRTLKSAIEDAAVEKNKSPEAALRTARRYLREIASKPELSMMKLIVGTMDLIFRRIFLSVEVDEPGFEKALEASRKSPVIYCPSHKSHLDYLLMGWLFIERGLMPTLVAAGANLSFFPLGFILRRGGAYFLRRTFKGNRLYATAFRTYIKKLMREGYNQEFFIEGGRSRTGKTLRPKLGMVDFVVTGFFEGAQQDVTFVPVALDYEKVLELKSYTKELTGGEKEPESIKSLLTAPKALASRYGRIYISFGEPFSLREFLLRENGTLETPAVEKRREITRKLGEAIVHGIDGASTVTPAALIAAAILAHPDGRCSSAQLEDTIRRFMSWISRGNGRLSHVLDEAPVSVRQKGPFREVARMWQSDRLIGADVEGDEIYFHVLDRQRLELSFYKNNLLHTVLHPALVASILLSGSQEADEKMDGEKADDAQGPADTARSADSGMELSELRDLFMKLRRMLRMEFSFDPHVSDEEVLARTLQGMEEEGLICTTETPSEATAGAAAETPQTQTQTQTQPDVQTARVRFSPDAEPHLRHYAALVNDLLASYLLAALNLGFAENPLSPKDLVKKTIEAARIQIPADSRLVPEALSKPILTSAIDFFVEEGVLQHVKEGKQVVLTPEFAGREAREALIADMERFIQRHKKPIRKKLIPMKI